MFFNNYSKPGKGVNKRNPDQPRIQIFRDVLPRKLWDLIKLNILYMLTAIPFFIVTMVVVGVVSSPIIDRLVNQFDDGSLVYWDVVLRIIFAFVFMVFLGQGPVTAGYPMITMRLADEILKVANNEKSELEISKEVAERMTVGG